MWVRGWRAGEREKLGWFPPPRPSLLSYHHHHQLQLFCDSSSNTPAIVMAFHCLTWGARAQEDTSSPSSCLCKKCEIFQSWSLKVLSFLVNTWACVTSAKSLQSCLTLCDPTDGSPPGSPIPGILQARTLEWVAISFSNAWKWKGKVKSLSCVQLLATPWTAAHQAPPFMGFSRQEYWSGVPLPSPRVHRSLPKQANSFLEGISFSMILKSFSEEIFQR